MNHSLHIEYLHHSTIGDCACGKFYIETSGADEAARNTVRRAYGKHEES